MTTDTTALKQRIDLLDLVGRDTTLTKVATTRGGEYAGPCPFCVGTDRFRVQPERGLWWCRQCSPDEHWQDVIVYVMKRDGVSFQEACEILEGVSRGDPMQRERPHGSPQQPAEKPQPEPAEDWRQAATGLVKQCEEWLWSDAGAKAREWLQQRGLKFETLRRWRVGYNPEDQKIEGLWVWRGITIPWFIEDELWHVKVRLPTSQPPKYKAVKGGHPVLYGTDTLVDRRIAVLCEGEFDCMLLWQEVAHKLPHVGMVTVGGADTGLSSGAIPYLLPIARIMVAYDMDAAGEKGAEKMLDVSARMKRIKVPLGKDITDFHHQGGRLRDWVESNIARLGEWDQAEADRLLAEMLERCAARYAELGGGQGAKFHDLLDVLGREVDDAMAVRDMERLRKATQDYERFVASYCDGMLSSKERQESTVA